jgi:hypothetical protein
VGGEVSIRWVAPVLMTTSEGALMERLTRVAVGGVEARRGGHVIHQSRDASCNNPHL